MKMLINFVMGLGKPIKSKRGIPAYYAEVKAMRLPNTEVRLYRWGSVNQMVKDIREYKPTWMLNAGHSYGALSIVMAARILTEFNFQRNIFADAIWRDKIDTPQFKSLFKGMRTKHFIDIPINMRMARAYYQRHRILQGHPFTHLPTSTDLMATEVNTLHHPHFDELPEFHNDIIAAITSMNDFYAL